MRNKGRKTLYAAAVLVAAVLLLVLTVRTGHRDDGTVSIDPAVVRELAEKDRAILRTGITAAFPEWVRSWKSRDAMFNPSVLQREGIEVINSTLITRENEVHVPLDDESLRPLVSPDGTKYLELAGGSEEGEPDSELTLVDAARSERQRLLFYGPSVRFDDVAWVDAETVVVVGAGSDEGIPLTGSGQPLIWIFHLQQQLVSTYSVSAR
jgi:hypothetical protein